MSSCRRLPTPNELMNKIPLPQEGRRKVRQTRLVGEKILRGDDERVVIFVGPCSIHNPDIALEYATLLKTLSQKVDERIFILMRVFIEKPRTQFGWKGFLYDPFLNESYDIEKGLYDSRKLLLQLVQIDIPIATEFLDPILSFYTQDLVSWGIIGARTSSSQIHRQMASHLPMPIGFKNGIDGNVDHAIYGALVARCTQPFIGIDGTGMISSITTCGNAYTHLILRGSLDSGNYDPLSVRTAIQKQRLHDLYSRLLIDCAHGNSMKDPEKQSIAFSNVLEQIIEGNNLIMGVMLESHLEGGNALSITDPCLNWETTEKLILWAYHYLSSIVSST